MWDGILTKFQSLMTLLFQIRIDKDEDKPEPEWLTKNKWWRDRNKVEIDEAEKRYAMGQAIKNARKVFAKRLLDIGEVEEKPKPIRMKLSRMQAISAIKEEPKEEEKEELGLQKDV